MSQSTVSTLIDRPPRRRHAAVRNYLKDLRHAPYKKAAHKKWNLGIGQPYQLAPLGISFRPPNPYTIVLKRHPIRSPNGPTFVKSYRQVKLGENPAFNRFQARMKGAAARAKFRRIKPSLTRLRNLRNKVKAMKWRSRKTSFRIRR